MIQLNKLTLHVLVILLSFFQTSCNTDDDVPDDSNAVCEGAICTAIFVRIIVSVMDGNQNPVALDSFTVTNLANGSDMTIALSPEELEGARETGLYPLTEDGVLDVNEEREIQFRGFINNQEVLSNKYTVSTDCCHVGLDAGVQEIVLSI